MQAISVKGLLGVYLFLPLALGYMLLDHFVFHDAGKRILPHHPESLLWYTLLFNLPHIIASFLSFADREYLAFYRRPLILGLPLIALLAFLLPVINIYAGIFMLILYTLYHNVSQQTGITMSLMRYKDTRVQTWRWVNIMLGLYLYLLVYPPVAIPVLSHYAPIALGALFTASIALMFSFIKHSQTREGVFYALGTSGIAGVGIVALFMGYPLFIATTLRVVHDITAFMFYVTHDKNRNREMRHNFIYRVLLPDTRLFTVGIPVLAIIATYIIQNGGSSLVLQAFFLISVTHFYLEGFMWKSGTPHRKYIAFQY